MDKNWRYTFKNQRPSDVRNLVNNLSNEDYEIYLYDIWALQLLQDLFCVEFGTQKCQNIMKGYLYNNYKDKSAINGTTDSVAYVTGCQTQAGAENGIRCIKYRGIENIWGNGSLYVDGIRSLGDDIMICQDPTKYSDINNYTKTSFSKLPSSGTIYKLGFDNNNSLVFPISLNTKGAYEDTYTRSSSTGEVCMYSGQNNDNIGLFTYNMSANANSAIPQNIFRMVRRPKQ